MTERHDNQDAQLDRNLRNIASRLALPAEPSARQRTAWRSAARHPASSAGLTAAPLSKNGARHMLFKSLFAISSSAAAAVVLFVLFFVNPTPPNRVEAGMILNNFRQALHQGFRVTIENIELDGFRAQGEILMQFAEPVNFPDLIGNCTEIPQPLWMTMDVSLSTSEDFEELPGLEVRMAGAATTETEWFFVKAERLPNEVLEALPAPIAYWLRGLLGNGVLFDLTGLDECQLQGAFGAPPTPPFAPDGTSVGFVVSTTDTDAPPPSGLSFNFTTTAGDAPAANDPADDGDSREQAAEAAIWSLFTGSAGGEQLEQILAVLTESSASGQVQETEPGLYVLTISDFADDDSELAADAVLRIAYREQTGVESFVFDHIGSADGSIRLEFCDGVTLDPALLDRNRVLEPDVTTVIDANMLSSLMGLVGGQ